ncbi:septal ring lytic transglycosylase RlpA family protein [Tahibacter amnicola]|uniref:Endolytic peptidoglycan transglycosylase RlpA n=1 Tax=Tahibacter amnicola TaxID=2976241 RepID=A0ABY6BD81_9GAMM|nr:septal ring lytic transglycosylase RlpA family protein [Tahibacter amnicola]UXI67998.1 septal ring lytic transglycosylase RlpA family protein [Tahibacter amnicola]
MNKVRLAVVALVALGVSACGGRRSHRPPPPPPSPTAPSASTHEPVDDTRRAQADRYREAQDSGPSKAIDVATIPEPTPQAEPLSRYGNRSPYSVLGKTYHVLPSANGYVERGISSWYGNKFHGYMTSSFEPYDMYKFTAAHKSLPLPSWARVTNLENGKSVVVRINDRGPFHDNRLIDLSYAAAVKIGVWPKGTGLVEVRTIGPGEAKAELPPSTFARMPPRPKPAPKPVLAAPRPVPPPAPGSEPHIYLQVGSYGEAANAARVARRMEEANLGAVQVVEADVNGRKVRRVRIGPLRNVDEADHLTSEIRRMGLGDARVAID